MTVGFRTPKPVPILVVRRLSQVTFPAPRIGRHHVQRAGTGDLISDSHGHDRCFQRPPPQTDLTQSRLTTHHRPSLEMSLPDFS
jgi:hypothetical protein